MSNVFLHTVAPGARILDPSVVLNTDNPLGFDVLTHLEAASSIGVLAGAESSLMVRSGWAVAVDGWLAGAENSAEIVARQLSAAGDLDLDGEFAVVAHHQPTGAAVVVRDHAGLRPLYIGQCRDRSWMASSSLKTLVATGAIDLTPDVGALRQMLATGGLGPSGSPYTNIRTVPSGTAAWLTPGAPPQFQAWWEPPRQRSTQADLRKAVERAVSLRLVRSASVDVECSGGLDSSTIAGIVGAHPERARATLVGLSSSVPATDEQTWQHAVENTTGLPAVWAPVMTAPRDPVDAAGELRSIPPYPNGVMWHDLHTKREGNATVALSGHGGDELFARLPVDVLRSLRGPGAIDILRHPRRRVFLRSAASVLKRRLVAVDQSHPNWMLGAPARQRSAENTERRWLLTGYRSAMAVEFDRPLTAPFGIQRTYPLLDRTVVEAGLSLPPSARSDLGDWRSLQRAMFADVLPTEVTQRRSKANFNHVYLAHIEASAALLAAPDAAALGLVDPARTQQLAQSVGPSLTGRELQQRWALIAVEAFLRVQEATRN